jgi:hypothetical protein
MSSCKNWPVRGELIDWRFSQSCWYFRPSFVNCCRSNLLSGSTPLPPFPVWLSILNTHMLFVRGGGGYGFLGFRQINTFRKVPLQVDFCRRHFALPSVSLIFLELVAVSGNKYKRGNPGTNAKGSLFLFCYYSQCLARLSTTPLPSRYIISISSR